MTNQLPQRANGRNFSDWLRAYIEYAAFSEAPTRMHFWSGVSAIAGALRRRVWIDMGYFKWYPNFYIVLVAPPGIVSKSTTASISMRLLRQVPGVIFGPDVVTWPALVTAFANASEAFQLGTEWVCQSAITLESGELGNLVNPTDHDLIDLLVSLWDSKTGTFEKVTKGNGKDVVENPWINMIACTTPAWIAGNFPEYVIGGGFTSRCLFIYAETKERLVAYPFLEMPPGLNGERDKLVQDLEYISRAVIGEYKLDADALEWGKIWYKNHYNNPPDELDGDRLGGYLARKQTHIHKTAMVIAASRSDRLIITLDDLLLAASAVTDLEKDMNKVFGRIGRTEKSVQSERLIRFIHKHKRVKASECYRYVHSAFPDVKEFDHVVQGAYKAGYIVLEMGADGQAWYRAGVTM